MMKTNKETALSVAFKAANDRWLLIDRAVEISGKSLANFMFEAAWEKARTVTRASTVEIKHVKQDNVSFVLSLDDFRNFVSQLEAQPKLNSAIQRLKLTTACWEPKSTK